MPAKNSSTLSGLNSLKLKTLVPNSAPSLLKKSARPILLNSQVPASPWVRKAPASETSPMLVTAVKIAAPARRALDLLPGENEDSVITGMTRSLNRRLLGLNIPQFAAQPAMLPMPAARVMQAIHTQRQPRIAS